MTVSIANLDPAQRAAVEDLDGPVIVQANPGAGKTAVIAARVARLLDNGIAQARILCITFTNKAADEMRRRIESYSGVPTDGMCIGTFHSICASLLKLHGTAIGLNPGFTILSDRESRSLLRDVIQHRQIGPRVTARKMQGEISRMKQQRLSSDDDTAAQHSGDPHVPLLYRAYQSELRRRGALDFDDLVVETARLLSDGDTRRSIASRFEYVLVDEFQDTTPIEAEIVKALASVHGNVCIVGDVKQSIYLFRGADYRLMGQFAQAFRHCHIHTLGTNYRSARRIIAASEQLISSSKATPPNGVRPFRADEGSVRIGQYETDSDEAAAITLAIGRLVTSGIVGYSGIAVLFRQHWVSETLERVLDAADVPFRLIKSDSDQVYETIVECLRCVAHAESNSDQDSLPKVSDWALANADLISNLRGMVACGLSLANLAQNVVDHVCGSDWQSHPPELSSLWAVASQCPSLARIALPTLLVRLDELEKIDRPADAVQLMSIHQSKGLEFPVVFVIGLEEGVLPSWQSLDDENTLEEERRLCYVAMTRAMDRLYVSTSQRRCVKHRGRSFFGSRFLAELNPDLQTNAPAEHAVIGRRASHATPTPLV